jgi:hypothetical protein
LLGRRIGIDAARSAVNVGPVTLCLPREVTTSACGPAIALGVSVMRPMDLIRRPERWFIPADSGNKMRREAVVHSVSDNYLLNLPFFFSFIWRITAGS